MTYLTIPEVIQKFRGVISAETLAVWRHQKKGPPYVKIGSRVLYPDDKLEEWEKERMQNENK